VTVVASRQAVGAVRRWWFRRLGVVRRWLRRLAAIDKASRVRFIAVD